MPGRLKKRMDTDVIKKWICCVPWAAPLHVLLPRLKLHITDWKIRDDTAGRDWWWGGCEWLLSFRLVQLAQDLNKSLPAQFTKEGMFKRSCSEMEGRKQRQAKHGRYNHEADTFFQTIPNLLPNLGLDDYLDNIPPIYLWVALRWLPQDFQ